MKKFFTILIILLAVGIFQVSAAEPTMEEIVDTLAGAMEDDFAMMLKGLGSDFEPILLQNAVSGQNVGMAELGSKHFDNFYFSLLPTVNLTVANGMFKYRDTQDYNDTLVLKGMLESMLFGDDAFLGGLLADPTFGKYVDVALNQATPFPGVKLNAGAKLPVNLELLVHGMWVPPAMTGLIPDDVMSELPGGALPTFSYVNIGAEVRYVLLRDSEQTPGMSIGLGGVYNGVKLEMPLGSILASSLGSELPDGADNPFAAAGMTLNSSVIGFGINTAISKKLAIFYPFVKLGAWYGITDFSGDVVLMEGVTISDGAGKNDMELLLSTGFDLMLGPFGSNMTVNYNLGSGIWGLDLGSRLQF